MSNKHFIGKRLLSFSDNGLRDPVSRVTLLVDDNNSVTAGDDTGFELLANCPYADETLAQALLNQVKGYQYRAFNAQSADLDPAAELGDGVTADGVYSVLAGITDKGDGYPDIFAPGDREEKDEYPEGGPMTRLFNRQLAATRSLIAKNSESVQILVERTDGVEKQYAELSVSLFGISGRVEGVEGEFAAFLLDTDAFYVMDESGNRTAIRGSSIDVTTLNVQNINFSGVISFKELTDTEDLLTDVDTALGYADEALTAAEAAQDTVSGWKYKGTTYIDSSKIMVTTLMATELLGGFVGLLSDDTDSDGDNILAGGLEIRGASTASFAVDLWSYGALSVDAVGGALYLGADDGFISIEEVDNYGYQISCGTDVIPAYQNGALNLGNYYYQWGDIYSTQTYAEAAEADTSDRNKKNSITYDLDRYDPFFDRLLPAAFKLNNGTSGRLHTALIAQDVEQALAECGIATSDFAGFIKIEDSYALRYGEFIALLIWQVQKLKARVRELEVKAT